MPMIATENFHPFNRCYSCLVVISIVSIFAIWSRYLSAQYEQTNGILEEIKTAESRLKNVRNQNLRTTISQEEVELHKSPYESTKNYLVDDIYDDDVSTVKPNADYLMIGINPSTSEDKILTVQHVLVPTTTEVIKPTKMRLEYYDDVEDDYSDEDDDDNIENTDSITTKQIKSVIRKILKETTTEVIKPKEIEIEYYDDVEDDYSDEDNDDNNIETTVRYTSTEVVETQTINDIENDVDGNKLILSDKHDDITEVTNLKTTMTPTEPPVEQMKYILIWTRAHYDPLMHLGVGQEIFIKKKCPVQNCHISLKEKGKKLLKDIAEFDIILFNGPDIVNKKKPVLPDTRDPKQNYVYASIESSDYYPMCDGKFDGYFNITWTYKLDSDISYGYMIARNMDGEIVAPLKETHWININEMKPINDTVKEKMRTKTKLASWMVSNCKSPSGRDQFVKKIQDHLKTLDGNWTVDIYGKCGTIPCERKDMPKCLSMFESDYYFYFAFENSFAEDYVTEKVLHPLQHYTVPVVYGAANYTRFLPEGIYLNALELGPEKVAEKMVEIAEDKEKYYEYFKWKNHYTFHYRAESPETDFHCLFCAAMNNEEFMFRTTVMENFKDWWNPPKIRRGGCPPLY